MHTDGVRTAVILDQHPIWLEALERILGELRFTPVGKTTNPSEALALVRQHDPTLFVLDVDTNGQTPDGLACLREACMHAPSPKAVVLSASEDPDRIETALAAGAVAYVLKRAEPGDLASAIRQVFTRSLFLAGAIQPVRPVQTADAETAGLTRRERE